MTVGELIERLKEFDPALPVCTFFDMAVEVEPEDVELRDGLWDSCVKGFGRGPHVIIL